MIIDKKRILNKLIAISVIKKFCNTQKIKQRNCLYDFIDINLEICISRKDYIHKIGGLNLVRFACSNNEEVNELIERIILELNKKDTHATFSLKKR